MMQIRRSAADQLYLVLLQNGDLTDESNLAKILDILTETCWEGDRDLAKNQFLELVRLAGLDISAEPQIIRGERKISHDHAFTDENFSYASLVDASGF